MFQYDRMVVVVVVVDVFFGFGGGGRQHGVLDEMEIKSKTDQNTRGHKTTAAALL